MTTITVLFNLKPEADQAAYETWARTADIPNVRRLTGCSGFNVLKVQGLLSGDPAPYDYVEIINVSDMAAFKSSVGTEAMQAVAAQFQAFAENPLFMVAESIE